MDHFGLLDHALFLGYGNTKVFFPASSFKGLADEGKEGEESNAKCAAAFFYYISDISSLIFSLLLLSSHVPLLL